MLSKLVLGGWGEMSKTLSLLPRNSLMPNSVASREDDVSNMSQLIGPINWKKVYGTALSETGWF